MTRHTQATCLNKLNSGAQGHSPGTGAHIGNHHDTGMAGNAPAALDQVAQRLLGNGASAGLMDAINTSQGTLGNRNFMQFVEVAQQHSPPPGAHGSAAQGMRGVGSPTQAAPVSDTGNAPLQMMRTGLAQRGMSALTKKSALTRYGASQEQPASGRSLSTSPRRRDWMKDVLFGASSAATLELAIKKEAATDSAISRCIFSLLDRPAPHNFPVCCLWDKLAFNFADRDLLTRRDLPYMAYAREAIATAVARAGNIYWALGRLHFSNVFADLFRTRQEHGTDPVKYMAEVSYPELMDKHGLYLDADTGQEVAEPPLDLQRASPSDIREFEEFHQRIEEGRIIVATPFQPLITSVEIIGFLMGDERKYLDRTLFFDARHQEVDRDDILSAFATVLDRLQGRQAEIGPENNFRLEPSIYRPLDLYTGYPCGRCDELFSAFSNLEEHWKHNPEHRP